MQPPRYYYPHHFVFYPVILAATGLSVHFAWIYPEDRLIWSAIACLFWGMAALSFMLRQHYALNNQNRIVRLEMRFRYYVLTQKRLEEVENRLSFAQLAALRFASDDELPSLIAKTMTENLSPSQIKKSIRSWIVDDMRA